MKSLFSLNGSQDSGEEVSGSEYQEYEGSEHHKDKDLSTGNPNEEDRLEEISSKKADCTDEDFVNEVLGMFKADKLLEGTPIDTCLIPENCIFLEAAELPTVQIPRLLVLATPLHYAQLQAQAPNIIDSEDQLSQEEQAEEEWVPSQNEPEQKSKRQNSKKRTLDSVADSPTNDKLPCYGDLFRQIKNTNMPKKFMKIFKASLRIKVRSLREQARTNRTNKTKDLSINELLRVLTPTLGRLEKANIETVGTKDLDTFFSGGSASSIESRRLMKSCLSQMVFDQVLRNDNIPADNKYSYLKCLKTMEWRMRVKDDSLVSRVQSHF